MALDQNPIDHQVFENFCLEAHCGFIKFGLATYKNFSLQFNSFIIIKKIAYTNWIASLKKIFSFIANSEENTPEEIISETFDFKILWKGSTSLGEKQYKIIKFYEKHTNIIKNTITLNTVEIALLTSSLFHLIFKTFCYDFYINHCLGQILSTIKNLHCLESFEEEFNFKTISLIITNSLSEINVEVTNNIVYHVYSTLKREKDIICNLSSLLFFVNHEK